MRDAVNVFEVKVAREPDGSRYGPAIFRVHYETHSYKPHIDHIDHVKYREQRTNYEVYRFDSGFPGEVETAPDRLNPRSNDSTPRHHSCFSAPHVVVSLPLTETCPLMRTVAKRRRFPENDISSIW